MLRTVLLPVLASIALVWGFAQVPDDARRVRAVHDADGVGWQYRWRSVQCRSGGWGLEAGPVAAVFGTVCEGDPWANR